MMKFIFFLLFVLPICLVNNMFWMVQNMLFLLSFIFIIFNNCSNYFINLSYFTGYDFLSYSLILLSLWIVSLMMMASEMIFKMNNYWKLFIFNILILLLLLVLAFGNNNLFLFYLFFEGSLIPTLFLIMGWGYQPERLQAGLYLLFYTLLVSLPMLIGLFYLYNEIGSMNFYMMNNYMFNIDILYISMILAFLVKMPMFLMHLWLPKAHVEAPISGSMILAGIMLKLGGYGLLRVYSFIQILGVKYNFLWISISLVGGVLISLICLRQTDLKSLIAYSSVAHMGIVLSGLMTLNFWGMCGSLSLMIGHGLCSSGLFCLANISYERLGSRSLLINSGLLNFMPSMTLWWFLLSSSNMAAPPSLNLLGEVSLLNMNCFILMTWQKIAPFMLMSYLISDMMGIMCSSMSVMFGAIGGLNQSLMRKLMAYSSINHLGWMISSLMLNNEIWMIYFMFYSFLSFNMIYMFNLWKIFHINKMFSMFTQSKSLKFTMSFNLLSLGGLPPFFGFIPKWIVIDLLTMNNQLMLTFTLIMFTLVTLYFYLRICYSMTMLDNFELKWTQNCSINNKQMNTYLFLSSISTLGLPLISLIYIML